LQELIILKYSAYSLESSKQLTDPPVITIEASSC